MTSSLALLVLAVYFLGLLFIASLTSKRATSATFFNANKEAPWYLVAFGMIGASLSGVTFVSVTGAVGTVNAQEAGQFSYMQMVLGYVLGYIVIMFVLLPLYYRLQLVSIYTYLEQRFGFWSYKVGASFFLLSRLVGASFRLYLVANVLQLFLFDELGIPFETTVIITIALIWLYTFRGGIKTIIWTDTLQTAFMLLAGTITMFLLIKELPIGTLPDLLTLVDESSLSQAFFFDDVNDGKYFFKQFFAGMFITITMTGLDQDMMQKNLTCKNIYEARKNMSWFTVILVIVNLLFLTLGALLYIYADNKAMILPASTDQVYPFIAKFHLGLAASIVFLLGITAAAYSTADSALTSLTTSFCIDFLNFNKQKTGEAKKRTKRIQVHLMFSVLLFIFILIFRAINDDNVVTALFKAAGYTYGPLLGLYAFGLFTKWTVRDTLVPIVCVLSPVLTYIVQANSVQWFEGYKFGFELIILNGFLTFVGLCLLIATPKNQKTTIAS